MPTNDFQTFASATGANVLTQAAYLALTSRTAGFQSGIAQSAQLNKVWRQSSIISSMIGQFICDNSGQNAVDDGTIATLESNFKLAIQNTGRIRATSVVNLYVSPTGSDANTGLTAQSPLLTINLALAILFNNYDMAGFNATINLAAGTYNQIVSIVQLPPGCPIINIVGVVGNASAVVITGENATAITVIQSNASVQWVQLGATGTQTNTNPSAGFGLACSQGQVIVNNVVLGACGTAQLLAESAGIITSNNGPVTFAGTSLIGLYSALGNIYLSSSALTFQAGCTYTNYFVWSTSNGLVTTALNTYAGTFTGQRYFANCHGLIQTLGAGANAYPGTTAGVVDANTYGTYI